MRGICLRRGLDQLAHLFARLLDQDFAGAVARLVGGDFRLLDPGAVRIGEEVVAGGDAVIDAREVDAVAHRRTLHDGEACGNRDKNGGGYGNTVHLKSHVFDSAATLAPSPAR